MFKILSTSSWEEDVFHTPPPTDFTQQALVWAGQGTRVYELEILHISSIKTTIKDTCYNMNFKGI